MSADPFSYAASSNSVTNINASDYPSLQAAIDAIPDAGGELYIPPGIYNVPVALSNVPDNTVIRGAGDDTVLNSTMSGGATSYSDNVFSLTGRAAGSPAMLISNVGGMSSNDATLNINNTAGFAAGDWVLLSQSPVQKELAQIKSVEDDTTMTLVSPPRDIYSSGMATIDRIIPVRNVVIENIRFTSPAAANDNGIYLRYAIDCSIRNSTFEDQGYAAVRATYSSGIRIENTRSRVTTATGFFIDFEGDHSKDGFVKDSSILNSESQGPVFNGIQIYNSQGVRVSNSRISGSRQYGIQIRKRSDYSVVDGCAVQESGYHGILVWSSSHVTVSNNKSHDNGSIASNTGTGIFITGDNTNGSDPLGIEGVSVTGNTSYRNYSSGINLEHTVSRVTVSGNVVDSNGRDGISGVRAIRDNVITGNIVTGNNTSDLDAHGGISIYAYAEESSGNSITDNTVRSNKRRGVSIDQGRNNIVARNVVTHNTEEGIFVNNAVDADNNDPFDNYCTDNNVSYNGSGLLISGPNSVVTGNVIAYNNLYGIRLHNAFDSKIYANDFLHNQIQAHIHGGAGNRFSIDRPEGGNYWSDVPVDGCYDLNADGFCDTPYVFPGGSDVLPRTVSVCPEPRLEIGPADPFWASYADYRMQQLSVLLTINNTGQGGARNLQIYASYSTNGVALVTPLPVDMGDIASGGTVSTLFKYRVPVGVSVFKAIPYATADDGCGGIHEYPALHPGR